MFKRILRYVAFLMLLVNTAVLSYAAQGQLLWLPTPAGEEWRVVQGYGCGTHDDWDHYSLDLVRMQGDSRGAPVYAAADGSIWTWVEASGTLLIKHGNDFYTMYTHLDSVISAERGQTVQSGELLGWVGDRGAPGVPHLHFTAFTQDGFTSGTRRSLPLSFADGYMLAELGGCNQHGGLILIARGTQTRPGQIYLPIISAPQASKILPSLIYPAMQTYPSQPFCKRLPWY